MINEPNDYRVCRNCRHAEWVHVKHYYYSCGRDPRSDFDKLYANEICPCKEFVPTDNLEYLEWINDKVNKKDTKSI